MIADIAARGYQSQAGSYAKSRPSYPPAAVRDLCAALGVGAGDPVVELGAGTGIFTRQLRDAGLDVTAVEPVEAMRGRLGEVLEASRVSAGTAEATGLPDGCAAAVFAASAWQWFNAEKAIAEVGRLLRPGPGGLGLAWNNYDKSVAWLAELDEISFSRRPASAPSPSHTGAWRPFFDGLPGWAPLQTARYANPWPSSPEGVIGRLMSSSPIAALTPDEQAAARDEARALLERHGLAGQPALDIPYVTTIYWTHPA